MEKDLPDFSPEEIEYLGGLLTDEVIQEVSRIDITKAAIPLAIALIHRIRHLWDVICAGPFMARFSNDEILYQMLRKDLLNQTSSDDEFRELHHLVISNIPDALPTLDELSYFDEEIRLGYHREFQHLETALIKFAIDHDYDPNPASVSALLVTHDDHLRAIEQVAYAEYEAEAIRRGIQWKAPALWENRWSQTNHSPFNPRNPGGRPRTTVPYDEAVSIYRSFIDDPYDGNAPTQKEFCQRFTNETGKPLSESVYRARIKEWEAEGRTWPPPDQDVESEA